MLINIAINVAELVKRLFFIPGQMFSKSCYKRIKKYKIKVIAKACRAIIKREY